jgi:hypothetical protein
MASGRIVFAERLAAAAQLLSPRPNDLSVRSRFRSRRFWRASAAEPDDEIPEVGLEPPPSELPALR